MSIEFSLIDYTSEWYTKSVELRDRILRKPLGLTLNDDDVFDDKNQYIVIGLQDEKLVACVMLKIVDTQVIKFRQMAVDAAYQGRGVGGLLIRYAENFCQLNEYSKVELHARLSAKGFYTKLGYTAQGDEFVEVGIPHIKMTKSLI
jgi:predicted GNAT family N-acyltransferase